MCCRGMFGVAYILLIIAFFACALGYVAPFWILYPESRTNPITKIWGGDNWSEGLWATCTRSNSKCSWFWESDFSQEKDKPDWFKAVQGLFGIGLLILILAMLLSSFHVCCCNCCKEITSISSAMGALTLVGLVSIGVGIGLYGGYMAKNKNVNFESDNAKFYWAFFVSIAGAATALVASILFFCSGCRRSHEGYHMTRVV